MLIFTPYISSPASTAQVNLSLNKKTTDKIYGISRRDYEMKTLISFLYTIYSTLPFAVLVCYMNAAKGIRSCHFSITMTAYKLKKTPNILMTPLYVDKRDISKQRTWYKWRKQAHPPLLCTDSHQYTLVAYYHIVLVTKSGQE